MSIKFVIRMTLLFNLVVGIVADDGLITTVKKFFKVLIELVTNSLGSASKTESVKEQQYEEAWQKWVQLKKKSDHQDAWEPSNTQKIEYIKWLKKYANETLKTHNYETKGNPPEGLTVPKQWKGFGAGHAGLSSPPPYAVFENQSEKALFCFQPRDNGLKMCGQKWIRYGYNAFKKKCEKFRYFGCGGNYNNFVTEKRCIEACVVEPQTSCCKNGEFVEYK